MGSFLRRYFYRLHSSYWFLPTIMAVGAILLSVIAVVIDTKIGSSWIDSFTWLYANKPEGARALLSTIAGSMITVAGVIFSITIVSVNAASGRYGPRILTNFMSDRGNQMTLGVFISTFIYCLMILRVVRGSEEVGPSILPGNDPTGAFVPHISILVAILMALASIGVLIYFIHHVTESIHISNVTARIAKELERQLDRLIEQERQGKNEAGIRPGEPDHGEHEDLASQVTEQGIGLRLGSSGYIEQIDMKKLLKIATDHDITIRICIVPGGFVEHGAEVIRIWPPARLTDEGRRKLRSAWSLSVQRTSAQDLLFPIDELIEIATIALSPGVNDPYTALTALNWLGSALVHALDVPNPDPYRYDRDGKLRVIIPRFDWIDLFDHVLDRLRPHVVTEQSVARRTMKLITEVAERSDRNDVRRSSEKHSDKLRAAYERKWGEELQISNVD